MKPADLQRVSEAIEKEFFKVREFGTDRGIITPERIAEVAIAAYQAAPPPPAQPTDEALAKMIGSLLAKCYDWSDRAREALAEQIIATVRSHAAPATTPWRFDMENAPKDRTYVLLNAWEGDDGTFIAYWEDGFWVNPLSGNNYTAAIQASKLWQPLPAAPSPTEGWRPIEEYASNGNYPFDTTVTIGGIIPS